MKTQLFVTAALACSVLAFAQEKVLDRRFISVSAEAGINAGSDKDKKFGLGGSVEYIMPDKLFHNQRHYLTVGLKGFNNPYDDGKFVSSIFNKSNDGLNYIALLGGYRMVQNTVENGWYFEPRIGYTRAASYNGFIFAPKGGYA